MQMDGHESPSPESSTEASRDARLKEGTIPRGSEPMTEDDRRTRRDIRTAIIFGVVAATIELGVLLYFFR